MTSRSQVNGGSTGKSAHSVSLTVSEFETDVRVAAKVVCADGVVALDLCDAHDRRLPHWEPGAHVDLIIDGIATRQYSLCGDRNDPYTWRLGILRDPNGRGSSMYVHDILKVGDTVRVRGPRNNFPLVKSPGYLFVAGGIGITPLLPMLAEASRTGSDWHLIYGGRTRASMAFLPELTGYGERVTVRPQDETGLLQLEEIFVNPTPGCLIYCCGPEPLLSAVESRCDHWPTGSLHVERFTPKPAGRPRQNASFEVVLDRSRITLTVLPGQSILETIESSGVMPLSSCTEGICGTCETRVMDGMPDHRDSVLTKAEREANDCMMICVSRALSPRLVLDL